MQIALGFYYHYKHDPSGKINNYAYEVLGVGCHTEKEETSPLRYVHGTSAGERSYSSTFPAHHGK